MTVELVEKLHRELYRLSEAYEQHPELDCNGYVLSSLFEEVMKFLEKNPAPAWKDSGCDYCAYLDYECPECVADREEEERNA